MCGIVGAVAQRNIVPVLIEGLRRLEYRGYDSCGVAVLATAGRAARAASRASPTSTRRCARRISKASRASRTRVGRRTARRSPTTRIRSSRDALALVHNGIIENYEPLREMLRGKGYEFVSQTDTEVIAHLIHSLYRGDLFAAVREAVKQLHGAYAIAVMHKDQPHTVVGARQGSPLVVGWATARTSSRRTRWRWPAAPNASSSWKRAMCASDARRRAIVDRDGVAVARSAHGGGVWRRGRTRPVSSLHAEGNLRAAARDHRHDPQARFVRRIDLRRRTRARRSRISTAC